MSVLYAKVVLSVGLGLVAWLLVWQRNRLIAFFNTHKAPYQLLFWAGFRLVPFGVIYGMFNKMPQSDLLNFFYPLGQALLKGAVPFRDIDTAYSPLFGYWMALPVFLWNDPRSVLLLLLLAEGLIVWLTCRLYKPDEPVGQRLFRSVFYYALPLPFGMGTLSCQEDLLMWGFVVGAILCMPKPYLSGLILGLGLLSTKAILVFIVVPMFFATSDKVRLVAGICTLCLPVALLMIWKTEWEWVIQPLAEGAAVKAPNLRSVLNPVLPEAVRSVNALWKWSGVVIITGLVSWLTVAARHKPWRHSIALIFIAIYGIMSAVQQSGITTYVFIFMLPLVFALVDFRRTAWCVVLIGFNVLAAIHPSLWWRLGQPFYDRLASLSNPVALLEYSIEILMMIGYVYYAVQAINTLRRLQPVMKAEPYAI